MLNRFVKLAVSSIIVLSSVSFAQSTDKNILPDLGTPEANTASIQPNLNAQGAGFNYRDNINGKILSVSPQYNRQNGAAIGGSFASPLGENMAAGILLMAGEDRNEWLINAGIDFNSHHRMIFSLGQLRQNLNFNFASGAEKTQITQDNIAASYQYLLGKDWLNAAEVNAYVSDANSLKLSDKTFFTDTASLYELWNDSRRIAGGRVTGAQGRLVFTPTTKTTIKVGLGAERLTYDYLMGSESTTRATGSAELFQRLEYDFNFRASVNAAASQTRYAIGLGKSFEEGAQLGIDLANIQGHDNTYNDTQLQLTYTQSFGGNNTSASASNTSAMGNLDATGATMNQAYNNNPVASRTGNTWTSSLVEQVSRRPTFLPSQVIAKVDTTATPVRLIAINKAATPPGSTVATATGIYTVPTVTPVSAIASITLNGSAFTNTGQFSLSGNNLVINPNLITQPAVGVIDTYVVTMNNTTGGGTTLATVTVSHGSTNIDSVVISSGTLMIGAAIPGVTPPLGGATPVTSLSGTGYTGTVTWSPAVSGTFAYNTAYTATVTLTPATGYTVTGVTADYFTVSGATASNSADSGVVSAVFPSTLNRVISAAISGVTAPVNGATPVTSVSGTGYTGTVAWSPAVSGNFASGTIYTATVTLTPATGYTVTGVTADYFTVSGATASNSADSGVVSAVFPATASPGFFTVNGVTSTPPSPGGFIVYSQAVSYCSSLTTSGKTWRLPTFTELLALNDSLTPDVMPDGWTIRTQTWSSTPVDGDPTRVRTIYMAASQRILTDSRGTNSGENAVAFCVTTQ